MGFDELPLHSLGIVLNFVPVAQLIHDISLVSKSFKHVLSSLSYDFWRVSFSREWGVNLDNLNPSSDWRRACKRRVLLEAMDLTETLPLVAYHFDSLIQKLNSNSSPSPSRSPSSSFSFPDFDSAVKKWELVQLLDQVHRLYEWQAKWKIFKADKSNFESISKKVLSLPVYLVFRESSSYTDTTSQSLIRLRKLHSHFSFYNQNGEESKVSFKMVWDQVTIYCSLHFNGKTVLISSCEKSYFCPERYREMKKTILGNDLSLVPDKCFLTYIQLLAECVAKRDTWCNGFVRKACNMIKRNMSICKTDKYETDHIGEPTFEWTRTLLSDLTTGKLQEVSRHCKKFTQKNAEETYNISCNGDKAKEANEIELNGKYEILQKKISEQATEKPNHPILLPMILRAMENQNLKDITKAIRLCSFQNTIDCRVHKFLQCISKNTDTYLLSPLLDLVHSSKITAVQCDKNVERYPIVFFQYAKFVIETTNNTNCVFQQYVNIKREPDSVVNQMITSYGSYPLVNYEGDASYPKVICYVGDTILNEIPEQNTTSNNSNEVLQLGWTFAKLKQDLFGSHTQNISPRLLLALLYTIGDSVLYRPTDLQVIRDPNNRPQDEILWKIKEKNRRQDNIKYGHSVGYHIEEDILVRENKYEKDEGICNEYEMYGYDYFSCNSKNLFLEASIFKKKPDYLREIAPFVMFGFYVRSNVFEEAWGISNNVNLELPISFIPEWKKEARKKRKADNIQKKKKDVIAELPYKPETATVLDITSRRTLHNMPYHAGKFFDINKNVMLDINSFPPTTKNLNLLGEVEKDVFFSGDRFAYKTTSNCYDVPYEHYLNSQVPVVYRLTSPFQKNSYTLLNATYNIIGFVQERLVVNVKDSLQCETSPFSFEFKPMLLENFSNTELYGIQKMVYLPKSNKLSYLTREAITFQKGKIMGINQKTFGLIYIPVHDQSGNEITVNDENFVYHQERCFYVHNNFLCELLWDELQSTPTLHSVVLTIPPLLGVHEIRDGGSLGLLIIQGSYFLRNDIACIIYNPGVVDKTTWKHHEASVRVVYHTHFGICNKPIKQMCNSLHIFYYTIVLWSESQQKLMYSLHNFELDRSKQEEKYEELPEPLDPFAGIQCFDCGKRINRKGEKKVTIFFKSASELCLKCCGKLNWSEINEYENSIVEPPKERDFRSKRRYATTFHAITKNAIDLIESVSLTPYEEQWKVFTPSDTDLPYFKVLPTNKSRGGLKYIPTRDCHEYSITCLWVNEYSKCSPPSDFITSNTKRYTDLTKMLLDNLGAPVLISTMLSIQEINFRSFMDFDGHRANSDKVNFGRDYTNTKVDEILWLGVAGQYDNRPEKYGVIICDTHFLF